MAVSWTAIGYLQAWRCVHARLNKDLHKDLNNGLNKDLNQVLNKGLNKDLDKSLNKMAPARNRCLRNKRPYRS